MYDIAVSKMLGLPWEQIQSYRDEYLLKPEHTKRLYNLLVKLKKLEWMGCASPLVLSPKAFEMLAYSSKDNAESYLHPFLRMNPGILLEELDNYRNTGFHYLCLMGRLDILESYIRRTDSLALALKRCNAVGVTGKEFVMLSGRTEAVKKMSSILNFSVNFFSPRMMFFAGLSCSTYLIEEILLSRQQSYGSWPSSLINQLANGIAWNNTEFPHAFYKKTIQFWNDNLPTLVVIDDSAMYQPVFFVPAYLPPNMHFLPQSPYYNGGTPLSRRYKKFPSVSKSSSGDVPELIEKMPEVPSSNIQSSASSPDSLATTNEDVSTVRNSPSEGQQSIWGGRNNFYIDNSSLLNPQPTEEYAWRTTKGDKPIWGGKCNFYPDGFLELNHAAAEKAEKEYEQELQEVLRRVLLS